MAVLAAYVAGCWAPDRRTQRRAICHHFLPGDAAAGATMTGPGSDDVAVIGYREEDEAWEADVLPSALAEDLAGLMQALRQQPSIGGTFGLVAVGDDFFVVLRAVGGQVSVFLSDLTAAVDWPLAKQVLDHLGIELPDDEDLDQVLPVGDLSIFVDLGIDGMDVGMAPGDLARFPDQALAIIARKLGLGHALDRALHEALGR